MQHRCECGIIGANRDNGIEVKSEQPDIGNQFKRKHFRPIWIEKKTNTGGLEKTFYKFCHKLLSNNPTRPFTTIQKFRAHQATMNSLKCQPNIYQV